VLGIFETYNGHHFFDSDGYKNNHAVFSNVFWLPPIPARSSAKVFYSTFHPIPYERPLGKFSPSLPLFSRVFHDATGQKSAFQGVFGKNSSHTLS